MGIADADDFFPSSHSAARASWILIDIIITIIICVYCETLRLAMKLHRSISSDSLQYVNSYYTHSSHLHGVCKWNLKQRQRATKDENDYDDEKPWRAEEVKKKNSEMKWNGEKKANTRK